MARKSFGAKISLNGTLVGELYSLTPPVLEGGTEETTHHGQANRFRTWISTLFDWGEVEGEMATDAATISDVLALIGVDDVECVITLKNGTTDITMTFDCILTRFTPTQELTVDNKMISDFALKVTGDIVFGGLA